MAAICRTAGHIHPNLGDAWECERVTSYDDANRRPLAMPALRRNRGGQLVLAIFCPLLLGLVALAIYGAWHLARALAGDL